MSTVAVTDATFDDVVKNSDVPVVVVPPKSGLT